MGYREQLSDFEPIQGGAQMLVDTVADEEGAQARGWAPALGPSAIDRLAAKMPLKEATFSVISILGHRASSESVLSRRDPSVVAQPQQGRWLATLIRVGSGVTT